MPLTIRQWRLSKEISQQAVADGLGVHVNTYRKMEARPNKIAIEDANKIAQILGVPMDNIDFDISPTLQNV